MSTQPQELPKSAQLPELIQLPKPPASRDRSPVLPKLPEFQNQCSQREKSVLDEPWRITMLPDDEVPAMVVPSPDAAPPRKSPSLPWRKGDVARLRDDTPEGMMRYIATHSSGWWQEMAERALRDTEKARRMAEESGWQPGQYWTLEVDVEAREKMRAQEDARRAREEEERAKEQAEKEAFARRQLELLKKAGKAPRCEYLYTDGRSCRAPQVRGERWCHGHARMMSYRPEKLELLPMEDEQAVTVNLYRVTKSLLSGRITEKVAGLALWSIAIAAPGAKRKTKTYHGGAEARRKTTKELPQINADGRRSESRHGRESTRKNTNHSGVPPQPANSGLSGDSGVTNHKSFVSGVGTGGTLVVGQRQSRENTLKRHCHDSHSRDLSTPPRVANASSESLKMTGIKECGRKGTHARLSNEAQKKDMPNRRSGHREIWTSEKQNPHSSVSPCPRGEIGPGIAANSEGQGASALKSTELHSDAQAAISDGHL